MIRSEYDKLTADLLAKVHALHADTGRAIEAIGGSAQSATAEWSLFYSLMRMAGVMADMLYDAGRPRASALEAGIMIEPAVPMICADCHCSVSYRGGDPARGGVGGYWYHDSEFASDECARGNNDVRAMVDTQ